MENKQHIVIYSHGFGVKKDDRGLLSEIAENLFEIESILFDYNIIDDTKNTLVVRPLWKQVKMLEKVITEARAKNPDAIIDLICHSQGCLIPGLLMPKGIHKILFLAPSMVADTNATLSIFRSRPGTVIDLDGISFLARKDGSTTIVSKEFWEERGELEPKKLYNKLAELSDITMIIAKQDDVLKAPDISDLNEKIEVLFIDGDHSFHGEDRDYLIKTIRKIILK